MALQIAFSKRRERIQAAIESLNEQFAGKVVTLASAKCSSDWTMRHDYLLLCPTTKRNDLLKADWIAADLSGSGSDRKSVKITFWQIVIWRNIIFNS